MQFMPSTFAAYGNDGDILSPRDSIMAAGRMLAANGFSQNPDSALFRYNNSDHYVGGQGLRRRIRNRPFRVRRLLPMGCLLLHDRG